MQSLCFVLTILGIITTSQCVNVEKSPRISLTVSSRLRKIEISWYDINPAEGTILLTDSDPKGREFVWEHIRYTNQLDDLYYVNNNNDTDSNETTKNPLKIKTWFYGPNKRPVSYNLKVNDRNGWHTTGIQFDDGLLKNLTIFTKCYGYWVSYLNESGKIVTQNCLSIHPTWMNDIRSHIGEFIFRDLFLVGTHDSGSYRLNFDAIQNETLVTKYSITQDFDIRTQLLHGVRYLDIRVGYYRGTDPQFWVNHGISRQQPLNDILKQVREFVLETNELVIFDVQEFPIGFGKNLAIHYKLVEYIQSEIGDLMVDPSLTWQTKLNDIWKLKKNIIVSYDMIAVVEEYPTVLWHSVQQRWGNVQRLTDLKRYLSPSGRNFIMFSSRPVADMAELTPNAWDVITDRYGGLRRMADQANREISLWYYYEWGPTTNIVAVDFLQGTSLMESSLYWNMKKELIK